KRIGKPHYFLAHQYPPRCSRSSKATRQSERKNGLSQGRRCNGIGWPVWHRTVEDTASSAGGFGAISVSIASQPLQHDLHKCSRTAAAALSAWSYDAAQLPVRSDRRR